MTAGCPRVVHRQPCGTRASQGAAITWQQRWPILESSGDGRHPDFPLGVRWGQVTGSCRGWPGRRVLVPGLAGQPGAEQVPTPTLTSTEGPRQQDGPGRRPSAHLPPPPRSALCCGFAEKSGHEPEELSKSIKAARGSPPKRSCSLSCRRPPSQSSEPRTRTC